MRTPRMKIQTLLPNGCSRQDMRPERRVETSAHFIWTRRGGRRDASLHLDHRLGLRVAKRDGDMATDRNLV